MTTDSDGTQTPPEVVKAATQQVRLSRITLIGVFGSTEAPGALIRGPDGKIDRVTVGDVASGGRVAAIGEDRVVIAKGGKTTVLKLPEV
ncbi:type II secretion system protein N [Sulfitobacter aestuariivivens]|uniref:Pilus assembly protein PilZ n=1 Tax=Sulfitobacter aestuariivivens TaxID=2766981 RepID=A0A927D1T0_9RHOB|nr:type II secretion system protein N [Sulfitobacter aestuariivivens]MBD3663525.1 pilus assembly protein PilZ [Sulfitobacter aestuariivivens]